jgi:hypothetical protein
MNAITAREHPQPISACRLCRSPRLDAVLELGSQALTGIFPHQANAPVACGPLSLVLCRSCQLVQLGHSYRDFELYGANYGYRSGLNASMVAHLSEKCHALERELALRSGDAVVDIGSNDGTFLRAFRTSGLRKIGIDPTAAKFRDYYDPETTVVPDFFSREKIMAELGGAKARLVTSIAMFYDLESPRDFVADVAAILAPDGLWHFEQSYMPSMLRMNSYDTICHEHLEYYSLTVIHRLLAGEGMKIVDIQTNSVNGGSFAVTAAHRDSSHREAYRLVDWFLSSEAGLQLGETSTYGHFAERIHRHRSELRSLIHALRKNGSRILGCGASTKGNVILQFCGLGPSEIDAISDINPDKWGKFTPGTGIPIVSEEEAREMRPDYMLVLPWHFKEGIVRREQEFLKRGGRLIFPLPEIEIVGF